jgi:leader peptidase (prepilin peptidase)/N-methyltransferase
VLIPLSIIDIKHYIIPDVFTLPGIAAAVIISFFPGGLTPFECVLGIAVGGGSLFLAGLMGKILFKKDEAMGGGDVRLMAMIGGLWGWKLSIAVIVLASFLGSIVGIGLLAFGLLAKDHKLPFGPFLACAAWAAVLTFDKLFGLYRAWLG